MSVTPYLERNGIAIYHGKCEEILPALPCVDVVITDPPYSASTHERVRTDLPDGGVRNVDLGFDSLSSELRVAVLSAFRQMTKRWVLTFSDVEMVHYWRTDGERLDLDYVRTGAWIRGGTVPQFSGDRPAQGFEAINIMHRPGKKRWNGGGHAAVYFYPIVHKTSGDGRVHPTQKPLALMRELVHLYSEPGELVLDAFMGSGTTLRACKDEGRRGIGIEIDEKYCEAAALRLEQETLFAPTAGKSVAKQEGLF